MWQKMTDADRLASPQAHRSVLLTSVALFPWMRLVVELGIEILETDNFWQMEFSSMCSL